MKRIGIIFIIICIVTTTLHITNPTPDEFYNWLDKEIASQTADLNFLKKGLINIVEKPLIKASTNYKDYHLFTVFIIESKEDKAVIIGILNNFISLNESLI